MAGPVIAGGVFILARTADLEPSAAGVAAVAVLMAVWWMTEALPLAAVALLPVVLFPLLGISPITDLSAAYAHPLVFLFLGGFLIGRAMQARGLSHWLALAILSRVGTSPRAVLAGLMAATAFLSLWISNTAAAMIMIPIAQAIADRRTSGGDQADPVEIALLLGVAYAATVGGMGTLVGTPPNALFAGYMATAHGIEIGFARWMLMSVPIVLVLLPLLWLVIDRMVLRGAGFAEAEAATPETATLTRTPTLTPEMRRVALVAGLAVAGWLLRPLAENLWPGLPVHDAMIAIAAALVLFVVPSGGPRGGALLSWGEAAGIRWDVLILFGGGLALAQGIESSGLAAIIGTLAASADWLPFWLLVTGLCVVVVLVGELASNTAMAALLLPIAAATASGLGLSPTELALPLTLAASLGFMLPVATPPNAIAFGAGRLPIGEMIRVGAVFDCVALAVVIPLALTWGRVVFG